MDAARKMGFGVETQISLRGEMNAVWITAFSIGEADAFRKMMETVIAMSREMGYEFIFYKGDMDTYEKKLFDSCGFHVSKRIVQGDRLMAAWMEL